ncbi:Uncharacterized protein AArcCO_1257 [Halalkaliarchaeum sp. AArc-CO]|uniref:hypothetical protein n=1 Tax=unclassified Halalkaliarchaeum TaxID=2678344 RepID=UPI00217EDF62|nr:MULTISPECIES: hypothetical protein [unclassified Halalkaliarchaeum]MDR5672483.1 hypothetical protein [Halalkaliarchaeum sp. AArc-GB]UWG50567.1 Uncharacterized protein AArcCO_1257 [Halalkaliarchaeum sp. AArc-CO]
MVDDRLSDGPRIAELLASELTGGTGPIRKLAVVDAEVDVEPSVDGAFGYAVERTDGRTVAEVSVQPDRAYVEFRVNPDAVARTARERGLRVRPKAVHPPRTIVFLEDGAQVKRVLDAFEVVSEPS